MVTRPPLNVLCLLLAAALPLACKADRSKPRRGAADAAVSEERRPIAAGGAADGGAAESADGGAASEGSPDAAPAGGKQPAGGTEPAEPAEPAEPREPPPTKPPARPPAKPPEPPTKPDDKDASKPTNLKTLPKTWTLAQVKAYMKNQVGRGLGVKCSHCHDTKDYAADGNDHKKAARGMIAMTSGLNRQYFSGKSTLSCFTCHQGAEHPAGTH
jgi:hypothetical protein